MSIRIVLLTGDARRHRWAARRLAEELELAGLVSEAKPPGPVEGALPPEDAKVLRTHFEGRDRAERALLGEQAWVAVERLSIPHGAVNDPETFAWVQARRPEALLLYGTGIVRAPLLEAYAGRVVNLHLGLSPYYRGAGTNFWPLVHGKPECVGATLHLATLEVDGGPVLAQVRPRIEPGDGPHEIGTRALMEGAAALPGVLRDYLAGRLKPVPQERGHGRAYRRSDFDAEAVRTLGRRLEQGMVEEYLRRREERVKACPIVERR